MRPQVIDSFRHQRLLGIALLWLMIGAALLLTTIVPAYTELFGWTPAFWLLGAPLALLLALEPGAPLQLLLALRRRRPVRRVVWH
ncbi:hypothetical protein [Dyella tabacisoli]|uniref:Uncharacterized protein n=1 Tax=Dyella tabacisoli TaxID=2282381 RepID=A0A369UK26_9GAMM|nr:hypothetical protein [Dyella tabacisoli]RDD80896.1 hypothetical protein DVJ77_14395 [Dyella tabacisoli]